MSDKQLLTSYSFSTNDIDLITYALRLLAKTTGMGTIGSDARELILFIDRQKEEKGIK